MTIAVAVVKTWTRAYTWGAPSAWAEQRRADIECDLWEQQQDPDGARGVAPAVHILTRLVAGMTDDLRWRLERTTSADIVFIRRAVTVALTTVALSLLWGSETARFDSCPATARKPRVTQVAACVGAFFEASPRRF
jgi:hypothetical protein